MIEYKLSEIVAKFGGVLEGADCLISGIAPTDLASTEQITFITDDKYKNDLEICNAAAVILSNKHAQSTKLPKIITDNPYLYFSFVSNLFNPAKLLPRGIKDTAKIDESTEIGPDAAISDYVVIGRNSKLGARCQVYSGVVIGDNVLIGQNVLIYPNVTIYDNVKLGDDCVIHAGTVIGSDGFGYAPDSKKHYNKIPQIGGVIIGNKVEIGANTTIDCGTLAPTIIEDGVIIDNLVQIAHNVKIGAHSAVAANVGISGSTIVGKHCTLAGGVGLTGHIELCDHTVIGGATNIGKSISKPDLYMGVYPASSYKDWAKSAVHVKNLSVMQQRIKDLEEKLHKLLEGNSAND